MFKRDLLGMVHVTRAFTREVTRYWELARAQWQDDPT